MTYETMFAIRMYDAKKKKKTNKKEARSVHFNSIAFIGITTLALDLTW